MKKEVSKVGNNGGPGSNRGSGNATPTGNSTPPSVGSAGGRSSTPGPLKNNNNANSESSTMDNNPPSNHSVTSGHATPTQVKTEAPDTPSGTVNGDCATPVSGQNTPPQEGGLNSVGGPDSIQQPNSVSSNMEDTKPPHNLSGANTPTPQQQQQHHHHNHNNSIPPNSGTGENTDFLDSFDSKDGVKSESCDHDGLPNLPDFKPEDIKNFDSDFPDGSFGMGPNTSMGMPMSSMAGPMSGGNIPMSSSAPQAQPLPSNVLGKSGDRTMDQQYMQQSSQIYVFSTNWANRGAEAVMQEQYPSIISWHESQPDTKKHLETMARQFPNMAKTIMNQSIRMSQMNKMMKGPKGQPLPGPGMRPMVMRGNAPIGSGPMGPGGPMGHMGHGPGGPPYGDDLAGHDPSMSGPMPVSMSDDKLSDMKGGPVMGPRGMMGGGPGGRMPGPPPPYPQSGPRGPPPGAMASPNPGSPATSLPMSSPAGMMNSPRPMGSNPGTPVSGAPMTSPVTCSKNSPGSQSNNTMPNAQDGMYGRSMQSYAKQGPPSSNKEANLMPVPSPQQIQFLNPLEGQELTIQKQPNTSLRDNDIMSPSVPGPHTPQPDGINKGHGGPGTPLGGPPTPSSIVNEMPPKYNGPHTPHTPNSVSDSGNMNFHVPSPQGGPDISGGQRMGPGTPITPGPVSDKNQRFPVPSPGGPRTPGMDNNSSRFPVPSPQMGPGNNRFPGQGGISPNPMHSGPNSIQDNMPLNPSTPTSSVGMGMSKSFDPISSMAQMSQQLTSSNTSTPCSTPGGMDGMNTMNTMCSMDNGMMMSTMSRNGNPMLGPGATFATVKASAPNTIQYLPSRPQFSDSRPRGPPSLDFLQRFSSPNSNECMDNNMMGRSNGSMMGPDGIPISQGMGTPPSSMGGHMGPMGPMGPNGPMMSHAGHMGPSGPMGPNGPMGHNGPMGPGGPMGPNGPMGPGGPMGPNGPMMGPNGPMRGMSPMMGPGGPMRPGMDMNSMGMGIPGPKGSPMGMGHNGPGSDSPSPMGGMCVPGPKGSPMGMGPSGPDPTQPLPPSGGNGPGSNNGNSGNFKHSPIMGGPTTSDPNYAQQFHNFQQQLYATNTRGSQMGPNGQMSNNGPPPGSQNFFPGGGGPPVSSGPNMMGPGNSAPIGAGMPGKG
eukprot:TCALIF_04465-PA protein Name:"Similar to lgs Protein BCL9 homolog (Drosophila melanogaster)" AED:0.10 eAED:0.15 QI:775/0.71/0.62/1/0.71/0.62/8/0/1146